MAIRLKRYLKSFTLIELIIVIAIIAVLGATAFLLLTQWLSKGRDATKISTIRTIKTALDINFTSRGEYPLPQDAVEHTGANGTKLYQGYVGANMVAELQKTPIDPTTKKPYVYSFMKLNGGQGYYQIGTTLENTVGYEGYNLAKADIVQTAKLIGNYEFDPSLPSLIIVGGNETSKGIYDPSNCYVLDGGKNTVDGAQCQPKKDMLLKDYDSGLVGYWDMESINLTGFYDLSGRGNDLACYVHKNITDCSNLPSVGVFSTGGLIGSGIYINGDFGVQSGNYLYQSNLNGDFDNFNNMSFVFNFKVDEKTSFATYAAGDDHFLLSRFPLGTKQWCSIFYFPGKSRSHLTYLTNVGFYSSNTELCNQQSVIKEFNTFYYSKNSSLNGKWKQYTVIINDNTIKTYIDGIFYSNLKYSGQLTIANWPFIIGNAPHFTQGLNGIIDEVKIYNRALSESEILQQAKIAGF